MGSYGNGAPRSCLFLRSAGAIQSPAANGSSRGLPLSLAGAPHLPAVAASHRSLHHSLLPGLPGRPSPPGPPSQPLQPPTACRCAHSIRGPNASDSASGHGPGEIVSCTLHGCFFHKMRNTTAAISTHPKMKPTITRISEGDFECHWHDNIFLAYPERRCRA